MHTKNIKDGGGFDMYVFQGVGKPWLLLLNLGWLCNFSVLGVKV